MAVKQVHKFIEQQNNAVKMEYANIISRIEKDGYLYRAVREKAQAGLV